MVDVATLKSYLGVNVESDTLLEIYLDTAINIVEEFLGYYPEFGSGALTQFYQGDGTAVLQLNAKPVQELQELWIDGVKVFDSMDELGPGDTALAFRTEEEFLYLTDGKTKFPAAKTEDDYNIKVVYTAGYSTLPGIISMTILRLGALLYTEADGNIGVTSKTFGDSGTRTFVQVTNYQKYLEPISKYRVHRLD